jgi:putative flippase GtrA
MFKWFFDLIKKILNYFLKFEFIRFGIVGFFNTVIDYGMMNLLMFWLKINQGSGFTAIKTFSIITAVIFSYYANLYWTFKLKKGNTSQLFQFVVLSIITIGVNVWFASYLVNYINVPFNKYLWANIASFIGAIIAIMMRYFGSRIIFKSKI